MNSKEFIAWEKLSRDIIDVKRIYVDIAGDLVSGVLLSQIIYWFLPDEKGNSKLRVEHDGKMWLAKERNDWWKECRITPRQYDRAIKELKELQIIETKLYKFNGLPIIHIYLNIEILTLYIDAITSNKEECKTGITQSVKRELQKRKIKDDINSDSGITPNVNPELPKEEIGNDINSNSEFAENANPLTENTPKTTTEITTKSTSEISSYEIWTRCLLFLEKEFGKVAYDTWFDMLRFIKFENYILYLSAPNEFTKGIIDMRYKEKMLYIWGTIDNSIQDIVLDF